MANDRMFIINKVTGRRFYLAKHFCQGWFTHSGKEMADAFQEYLDEDIEHFWGNEHAYAIGYEDTEEEFDHLPMIVFGYSKQEKKMIQITSEE